MSSGGEYGKIKSPHKETDECNPKSFYSRAKFLATSHLIRLYNKHSFPFTVLRLYQAYGEKQDINRLIPIVITSCIKDKQFPCSEGKQFRDFIHVKDVVGAIIKSIRQKKSKGQIFNLGSGKLIQIKKLIIFIRNKIGKGEPLFGQIGLRNEESLKVYPEIKKIKNFLNWQPKILLKSGINNSIKYYKKELVKKIH